METASETSTPSPFELSALDTELLLPRYEVMDEIGRGGMGVVYRARHKLLDSIVAIKVCLPGKDVTRFQREAQVLASIRSQNVIGVHDFEMIGGGRAIIVMDWIDGQNLGNRIRQQRSPMSEETVSPWMKQVCQGMQTVADQGV